MAAARIQNDVPAADTVADRRDFREPRPSGPGTPLIQRFENVMNKFIEKYVKGAPKPVLRVITRILLYPTLWYNLWTQDAEADSRRPWYTVVEDRIVLGALPYARLLPKLKDRGVTAVLNTVGEWNGNIARYRRLEWSMLWIPIVDFTPPTLEELERGVDFIQAQVAEGRTVYVHCKAGKGRSATMVMGWLIRERGMRPREAQAYLSAKRPQVVGILYERDVVKDLAAKYNRADLPVTESD